jgi:hypothetical protein
MKLTRILILPVLATIEGQSRERYPPARQKFTLFLILTSTQTRNLKNQATLRTISLNFLFVICPSHGLTSLPPPAKLELPKREP